MMKHINKQKLNSILNNLEQDIENELLDIGDKDKENKYVRIAQMTSSIDLAKTNINNPNRWNEPFAPIMESLFSVWLRATRLLQFNTKGVKELFKALQELMVIHHDLWHPPEI